MKEFFSSLLAGLQNAFSFGDLGVVRILLTLALAFLLGMFIFTIYRKTFSGVMYSKNFGVSLVMLSMVTSFIILPITSNLTLSLGMVGALSIVRFRTAVKDPIDTVYMFWSIAVGISLGAKFFLPAILASVIIGFLMLILSAIGNLPNLTFRIPNRERLNDFGGAAIGAVNGVCFGILLCWALQFAGPVIGCDTLAHTALAKALQAIDVLTLGASV